ncbi:3-hydroxyacid dehydrogenase/reductase [Moelleriella libera RCEF 2490]|uniref:3-hydroxyisobutyrate dehydrogenase n=1 Tax=Moelleriella libera RCEF 2490 TaxID=1081109 RepID=A0A168BJT1_9HYPO|nr:3-hydroxyacid dehydrogenase/reductase [Moelleriella libera RCEF 2490]
MAKNLQSKLQPADKVVLFDINAEAMKNLAGEVSKAAASSSSSSQSGGAEVELAPSAWAASKQADMVITVLPEPQHVRAVYQSILTGAAAPAPTSVRTDERVFIDCSTIDPSTSRSVAASVGASGQGVFVDAPMSGGVVGAAAGTLTFMLGCHAPDAGSASNNTSSRDGSSNNNNTSSSANTNINSQQQQRISQTLLLMGKRILHCGAQGSGLSAKLANNYLLAINNIATAEAMNLGMKWGLDAKILAGVINASTGRCWPSEVNNPVRGVVDGAPAGRDYRGGFGIGLMKKDLRLALVAAEEAGARMALAGAALGVYDGADRSEGCKGRDFSVVYRYLGGEEQAP